MKCRSGPPVAFGMQLDQESSTFLAYASLTAWCLGLGPIVIKFSFMVFMRKHAFVFFSFCKNMCFLTDFSVIKGQMFRKLFIILMTLMKRCVKFIVI